MFLRKGFRASLLSTYSEMGVIGANGEPPFYYMELSANLNFGGFSSKYPPLTEGILVFKQDGVGGHTVNFGSHLVFVGASGLDLAPGAFNVIDVVKVSNTVWVGNVRGAANILGSYVSKAGDTMNVDANIVFQGAGRVTGLPPPMASSDAVNKAYADGLFAGIDTDEIAEGTVNLFFTTVRVRQTLLGTVSFVDSTQVADTDNIVQALQKLQTQSNLKAEFGLVQTWTAAQRGAIYVLIDGATITPDFNLGNNFSVTLGGNRVLGNPDNLVPGQCGVITLKQDATGGRSLSYGSYWKFSNGTIPTLTAAANAKDQLVYFVDTATEITARLIPDVK